MESPLSLSRMPDKIELLARVRRPRRSHYRLKTRFPESNAKHRLPRRLPGAADPFFPFRVGCKLRQRPAHPLDTRSGFA